MVVHDGLAAHIVSDCLELGLFNQGQVLLLYLKAVIHIAHEVHQLLICMDKSIRYLIKDNVFRRSHLHDLRCVWIFLLFHMFLIYLL